MRTALLAIIVACCAGCPGNSLTDCSNEPDITGSWTLSLSPTGPDGGAPTLPAAMTISAQLKQIKSDNALGLSSPVWGTLTASDPNAFGTLTIPELMHNDGSKTGAIFGCTLQINVPIAAPVSDDDVDQGPLRLALGGSVTAKGVMAGALSTMIRVDDPKKEQRSFTWTGAQH
jgi:hypothetical protein